MAAMKKIKYTYHADKRISERDIDKNLVKKALAKPDITAPCKDSERKRVMKSFGDKTLDVIYVEKKDKYIIITVVWLEKRRRGK